VAVGPTPQSLKPSPHFSTIQIQRTDSKLLIKLNMAAVYIIGGIIAAIALYFTLGRKSSKYNYPPSPPGYNVLKGGHAYLFPPNLDVHLPSKDATDLQAGPVASKWADELGDMYVSLRFG
jgi:hypothetical protein